MSTNLYGGFDVREIPAYPISDVAYHLRIPINTLRSWVRGRPDSPSTRPIIKLPNPEIPELSFVNLVEAHVLKIIRADHRVPLLNVRKAVDFLEKQYGQKHALADVDFLTDNKDLFLYVLDTLVNATRHGQIPIRSLAEAYLSRIERDTSGHAACLFPIVGSEFNQKRIIAIDPSIFFGRPRLIKNDVPTDIIYDRFLLGDSLKTLAADYEHDISDIECVIEFEKKTTKRAA